MDYEFTDWNKYIDVERSNKYAANTLKQKEMNIVRYYTIGKKYEGDYPVQITFRKYFKDKRKDLDNVKLKSLLDGLVKCGVLKNDNLNCVQRITLVPIFDTKKEGIEIEIDSIDNVS